MILEFQHSICKHSLFLIALIVFTVKKIVKVFFIKKRLLLESRLSFIYALEQKKLINMVVTTALGLTTAIYAIFIGVAIIGLWIMLILKKQIPELETEPIEIYFHISAEMLMGIISVVSGIIVLVDLSWGSLLFLISSGFCLYSVVNSAGYYAQRKNWPFIGLFSTIFIMSSVLSIFHIITLV